MQNHNNEQISKENLKNSSERIKRFSTAYKTSEVCYLCDQRHHGKIIYYRQQHTVRQATNNTEKLASFQLI